MPDFPQSIQPRGRLTVESRSSVSIPHVLSLVSYFPFPHFQFPISPFLFLVEPIMVCTWHAAKVEMASSDNDLHVCLIHTCHVVNKAVC